MNVLVTGGAGYIGSQVVKELLKKGFKPIIYDNLSTGHKEALLGGEFIEGELSDIDQIDQAIKKHKPKAVIHFAASIEVEQSAKEPENYFENNLLNGLNLLKMMKKNNVSKFIFSSSAAVYGQVKKTPIDEGDPKNPLNPYGLTKLMFEQILSTYKDAYGLKSISLRYFNAAGADPSGRIGQDSKKPTHLITRTLLTALGKYPEIEIFGTDYQTKDGTCIRDYIHVKDLATTHILALKALDKSSFNPVYNLGTGSGYSVKEVIEAAKKITGINFKVKNGPRRPGDPAILVASNKKAKKELGFKPQFSSLETIIETAWQWHKKHPEGYKN